MRTIKVFLAVLLIVTLASAAANAEERNPMDATFVVDLGTFLMSTDMQVRLDGETTGEVGTDINFDETFGIGDFDRFRAEAFWRFGKRHAIHALYFENNRSATRTINRDIIFGDTVYPLNATLRAGTDVTVIQLSYEYAFLQRESYEIAAGLGVHYIDMGLSLRGEAAGGSFLREEDASTEAPMPVLGVHAIWRPWQNFYFTAQIQYFHINLDPYSGGLTDLKASAVWQFSDHVGIGVGYNDFRFRFDIEDEDKFNGRLRWDYGGVLAFATVMF